MLTQWLRKGLTIRWPDAGYLTLLAAPPVDEAGWGQKESGAQGTMPVQAPLIQCHCYAMYSSC